MNLKQTIVCHPNLKYHIPENNQVYFIQVPQLESCGTYFYILQFSSNVSNYKIRKHKIYNYSYKYILIYLLAIDYVCQIYDHYEGNNLSHIITTNTKYNSVNQTSFIFAISNNFFLTIKYLKQSLSN